MTKKVIFHVCILHAASGWVSGKRKPHVCILLFREIILETNAIITIRVQNKTFVSGNWIMCQIIPLNQYPDRKDRKESYKDVK